jgi:hypothetical protein
MFAEREFPGIELIITFSQVFHGDTFHLSRCLVLHVEEVSTSSGGHASGVLAKRNGIMESESITDNGKNKKRVHKMNDFRAKL